MDNSTESKKSEAMTQTLLKHWLATKSRLVIDSAAINFHFSAVRIPLELSTSVVSL